LKTLSVVDVSGDVVDDQLAEPASVGDGPQKIGAHSGGSTGSLVSSISLLISGAVYSIAALLGTADRSTNMEVVTCVSSGLGSGSLLVGAADWFATDEQETVVTNMNAAAVTANRLRRLASTATMPSPVFPKCRCAERGAFGNQLS
jgi:hypothetical protein